MDRQRIQAALHLKSKNWRGDIHCKLCGCIEDTNHVIFQCSNATLLWTIVRDMVNWNENPDSSESFFRLSLRSNINGTKISRKNMLVLYGAIAWALWKIRNDLVFNDIIVSSVNELIFKSIFFVQKWTSLSKKKDRDVLWRLVEATRRIASSL